VNGTEKLRLDRRGGGRNHAGGYGEEEESFKEGGEQEKDSEGEQHVVKRCQTTSSGIRGEKLKILSALGGGSKTTPSRGEGKRM